MRLSQSLLFLILLPGLLSAEELSQHASPVASSKAIAQAVEEFASTGTAPVLRDGLMVRYPFGSLKPDLNCAPTNFCDVELEAGEVILGIAAADPSWIAERLVSGTGDDATPHVILKPTEWDASTALLITTNRRTYHLQLSADRRLPVTSYVGYYFPRDLIRFQAEQAAAQKTIAERLAEATVATIPDLSKLDCSYRIRGKGPIPLLACDDGIRTYLFWGNRRFEAPAVFAVSEQGERSILNHRTKGSWFILDTVSPRFELRAGRFLTILSRSRDGHE